MKRLLAAFIFLDLLAMPAYAAPGMFTRTVHDFRDRELTLVRAIQDKNIGVIDSLVANDFFLRATNDPDHAVSREEWVKESVKHEYGASKIERLTVLEYPSVVVVNYIWKVNHDAWFVVDIWYRQENRWKLSSRLIASGEKVRRPIPGVPSNPPSRPKDIQY